VHGLLTAPGLYLHHAETPLPPVGTAVTGFVGVCERGPINVPQPIHGWSEYVDTFGRLVPFGFLAESVFGFFQNGGEKCWVVRVADTSRIGITTPAGQCAFLLPLASAESVAVDHNGDQTIRFRALDPGAWGNELSIRISTSKARPIRVGTIGVATTVPGTQITLDAIADLRPGATIRITNPDGVSGIVERTIGPAAAALDPIARTADLTAAVGAVFPIGSVVYAFGMRIEAEFAGRREIFDSLSMRPDQPRYFARIINAAPEMTDYGERRRSGFSSLVVVEHLQPGGVFRFRPTDSVAASPLRGGSDTYTQARGTFVTGAATTILALTAKRDLGTAGNGLEVTAADFSARLALAVPPGGATLDVVVDDVAGFRAGEQMRVGISGIPPTELVTPNLIVAPSNVLSLPAALVNAYPVGTPVSIADRFSLEARRTGDREARERIRNLSGDSTVVPRFVRTVLALESELLCASTPPAPFTTPSAAGATTTSITLTGGADPGLMDQRYYTGYQPDGSHFHPPELPPETIVGLATLERVEEIGLVCAPDLTHLASANLLAAQTSVLRHCATLGDRFALLDAPREQSEAETDQWATALGATTLRAFGAALHPWIRGRFDDAERLVPPSGMIAGVIARTDAQRGVNKAPANEQVKGAFSLEPPIDRRRHGPLNLLGVNCILKLEDGDVRLMGARTLSDDPALRYVNVRRTILTLKKILAQRMLWTLFEPLTPDLERRIEDSLRSVLESLVAKGVTASQRPADAFYVKCNAETNPRAQTDLGIVVAEIGIALLAPAEFIVLTARRTPDAVQVIEEEV
jgi:uncharacterized protein